MTEQQPPRLYRVLCGQSLLGCVSWPRAFLTRRALYAVPSPPSSPKLRHVEASIHQYSSDLSSSALSAPPSPCGAGRVRNLAAAFDARALQRSLSAGNSPRSRGSDGLLSSPSSPVAVGLALACGGSSYASAACTPALSVGCSSSSPRSGISFCSLYGHLPSARKSRSESGMAC